MKRKKHFPRTMEDAIESDRCHIEIMLGRQLAPFEEVNYTYISNRVEEYWERHQKSPLILMDYENGKFKFFVDKVREREGL